jgi:uncharacterized protein (DUF4415 family)
MNEKHITRRSLDLSRIPDDLPDIPDMSDDEIQRAVESDPDAAPLVDASWFEAARRVEPMGKVPISIRVDRDVLEFFKAKGDGYLTRMNGVLRAFMEHERRRA